MNTNNINRRFFYSRFTTEDLETSSLRSKGDFQILSIIYDGNKPILPIRAMGQVVENKTLMFAVWNEYGECSIDGQRSFEHDMLRNRKDEINASVSLSLIVLSVLVQIFKSLL